MRFRIATLLYVIAYLAVSIAAFGAWGILAAVVLLGLWGALRLAAAKILVTWMAIALLHVGAIAILRPVVGSGPIPSQSICRSQMRWMGMALQTYAQANGGLPDTTIRSEVGEPLYSWRTVMLPHLEEEPLYNELNLAEPWDGPNNRPLTSLPLWTYCCPQHRSPSTEAHYFAIVDDRTVWSAKMNEPIAVPDGLEYTILLIEADLGVCWAEPRDLTFEEAVDLLTGANEWSKGHGHRVDCGYFIRPAFVLNVLFADGHSESLCQPLSRELATALLTANGGEEVDSTAFDKSFRPQLDFGRFAVCTAFCILSLAPARWAFSRRVEGDA